MGDDILNLLETLMGCPHDAYGANDAGDICAEICETDRTLRAALRAIERENADLYEQLDAACNLLSDNCIAPTSGSWNDGGAIECANCGYELIFPEDFGHEGNHSAECDSPTVFALRDRIRRRNERDALEREVNG